MKNKIKVEVAKATMMIRRFPMMIVNPIFFPYWRLGHHGRQRRPAEPPHVGNWRFFVACETEKIWIKFSIVFFQTLLNYFFRIATLTGINGPVSENGGLKTSDISIFGDPCLSPQSQVVSLAAASKFIEPFS